VSARALSSVAALSCLLGSARPALAQIFPSKPEQTYCAWHEGEPIPPGYTRTVHSRTKLVAAGAILLASTYAVNITGVIGNAVGGGPSTENWLLAPGVGPLILMAQTTSALGNVFLAADALAQLSGVAMIVYGLAAPVPALVRDERGLSVTVLPLLGAGRSGVGLVGSF
jgi:hypothetical protein